MAVKKKGKGIEKYKLRHTFIEGKYSRHKNYLILLTNNLNDKQTLNL